MPDLASPAAASPAAATNPAPAAQIRTAVRQTRRLTATGLLESAFARMFEGLVYAQIWEDPVADMAALDLRPGAHLICIASGGCNMMSYLTARPGSVTAVDLSPAHVALGRLKLAAVAALPDHAAFHDFFARADLAENVARYDRLIAPALDPESRAWWDGRGALGRRRIEMFARGFYRHGALGRFIGTVHGIARIAGVDFRPLLEAETLEAQAAFFDARIAPLFETRLVRGLVAQRASLFGLGIPPAQYDKLAADGAGSVLPVLRERTRRLMCDFPIRDNYFAWQAFARGYDLRPGGALPPYLEPGRYDALREAAGRGAIVNRSLTDRLAEAPAGSLDAYVLLDAQDWMSDAQLNALWAEIDRTAAPGARVLFRTGGTPDILPGRVTSAVLGRWRHDAAASAAAFDADRSAIYGGVHLYRHAA